MLGSRPSFTHNTRTPCTAAEKLPSAQKKGRARKSLYELSAFSSSSENRPVYIADCNIKYFANYCKTSQAILEKFTCYQQILSGCRIQLPLLVARTLSSKNSTASFEVTNLSGNHEQQFTNEGCGGGRKLGWSCCCCLPACQRRLCPCVGEARQSLCWNRGRNRFVH